MLFLFNKIIYRGVVTKKILEDLYWNHIQSPSSHHAPSSKFTQIAKEKSIVLEKLMQSLNSEEQELFDKYCALNSDIDAMIHYQAYIRTLQFGIGLMLELFHDEIEVAS